MPRTDFNELLDAGAHFGHLKRKWSPAMAPYIFTEKNGIHIIDLPKLLMMKLDANRYRDRADYVELIKANKLTKEYISNNVIPLISNNIIKRCIIQLFIFLFIKYFFIQY